VNYLYLIANSILLLAGLYMFTGMSDPGQLGNFIFYMGYVILPYGLSLYASIRYLRGVSKQATWPVAGVVAGFLACLFYAGTFIYDVPEDGMGLILMIMPSYHLVGFIMAGGVASYIINKSHLDDFSI
jgi:hypothetical protein